MFKSVKSNKLSDNIAEQIRTAILEGKLKPGDKLPSEKQLIETFGVSKATLREALRLLEVLGFLEIHQGVSGGAYVVEVDMKTTQNSLINFLHFQNLSLRDLFEVRFIIEPHIARKAALSIKEEDLKRLKKLIEECDYILKHDIPIESRKNEIEFHRIIGSVTGNPILLIILDFVENLFIDAKEILQPSKKFSEKVLKAHKRIYKALVERNPQKAQEEMTKHVLDVEKDLIAIRKERHIEEPKLQHLTKRTIFRIF